MVGCHDCLSLRDRADHGHPEGLLHSQVDSETSRHYAEIVVDLRKAGTPILTNDIWIAAAAARNGTTVLTCNDHFELIGRVGAVVVGA